MCPVRSTIISLTVLVLGGAGIAPAQTPISLTLSPANLVGGGRSTAQATLSGPVAQGFTVQLSSSNQAAVVPQFPVAVPTGATVASFEVQTAPVLQSTVVTISVTANGSTRTAQLTISPPVPASVTTYQGVTGGLSTYGSIALTGDAPREGGPTIQLSSSNPAVATVPASVTVGARNDEVGFPIATTPVVQTTVVTITATSGGVSKTAQLAVLVSAVSSLTFAPAPVTGGQSSTGHLTLTGPAPAGGLVASLSSSNSSAITLPETVPFAAGTTTASFLVPTSWVGQSIAHNISATLNGVTKSAQLTVLPLVPSSLTLASPTTGGQASTGQLTLSGAAPKGGVVVTLSSSAPAAVAVVPASVTVPGGMNTKSFPIPTGPVPNPVILTVTATAGGTSRTAQLMVVPPVPSAVSLSPGTIRGLGASSTGQVTINAPAPAGGLGIQLSSSKPGSVTVPASVMVPAGQSTASFPVNALPVGTSTTATITASRGGVSATALLTVTP
jgi:hypothetical protein